MKSLIFLAACEIFSCSTQALEFKEHLGASSPDQGLNLGPLRESAVLATGLPGMSWGPIFQCLILFTSLVTLRFYAITFQDGELICYFHEQTKKKRFGKNVSCLLNYVLQSGLVYSAPQAFVEYHYWSRHWAVDSVERERPVSREKQLLFSITQCHCASQNYSFIIVLLTQRFHFGEFYLQIHEHKNTVMWTWWMFHSDFFLSINTGGGQSGLVAQFCPTLVTHGL